MTDKTIRLLDLLVREWHAASSVGREAVRSGVCFTHTTHLVISDEKLAERGLWRFGEIRNPIRWWIAHRASTFSLLQQAHFFSIGPRASRVDDPRARLISHVASGPCGADRLHPEWASSIGGGRASPHRRLAGRRRSPRPSPSRARDAHRKAKRRKQTLGNWPNRTDSREPTPRRGDNRLALPQALDTFKQGYGNDLSWDVKRREELVLSLTYPRHNATFITRQNRCIFLHLLLHNANNKNRRKREKERDLENSSVLPHTSFFSLVLALFKRKFLTFTLKAWPPQKTLQLLRF